LPSDERGTLVGPDLTRPLQEEMHRGRVGFDPLKEQDRIDNRHIHRAQSEKSSSLPLSRGGMSRSHLGTHLIEKEFGPMNGISALTRLSQGSDHPSSNSCA